MIYLLYGPDTVSSRTYLLKLKKNYSDHTTIEVKRQKDKVEIPTNTGLFGNKRLIIVENLIPKEEAPFKSSESIDIVIWTSEVVIPPKWVDKSLVFKQENQASTFKLADAVSYGQEKQALLILKNLLLEKTPVELIIGSLVRQLRLLSLVIEGEVETISKSSFVQEKTREQGKKWSLKKVKKALLLVMKADFGIKTGQINAETALTLLVADLASLGKD
jgi:DNA polymerase III delta subunit